jgi:hypothetical protein
MYLGHDEYYPNWECIRTPCLMTMLFFVCFSQIHMKHALFLFRGVFPNNDFVRFILFFKKPENFAVMSNSNVHATLMICISSWRKIFYHGDWFRRWLIWSLVFEFSQQRRIAIHFIMTLMNASLCFESAIPQSFSLGWLKWTF